MSLRYSKFVLISIIYIFVTDLVLLSNSESDTTATRRYQVEEVTIMAPKDAMEIKLLPSSITLIEGPEIINNNIRNIRDFTAIAPNFFMPDYGSKLTSPVYIRGIGSRINSPSVGLNVDYVPYFEKAAFDFDLFDIERVEILRGPQGTLYGRNTMGGIINVFTKSPLKHNGSEVGLNVGNYGFFNASANHYGNIRKTFGYSVSMNYINEDGYFTNAYNNKKVDDMESISSRVRLIHQPNDYFSFENTTSIESSDQGGYPYSMLDTKTGIIQDINYNARSSYNRDLLSNAFVFKIKAPVFELVSTTSFQYLTDQQRIDQDFTDKDLYFVIQDQNQKMLSQEVIIKSPYNPTYEWLFGAYGFFQGFDNVVDVENVVPKTFTNKEYLHDIYGGALFHQSTLNNIFIKNFSIIAGIRADYELDELEYHHTGKTNGTSKLLADTLYPALKSFEIMPKFALKYEINYYTNIYTSVSKGYKTGGFNSTFERPEDLTFDPEHSWNYEAGLKLSLLNGMIFTDFAVFYIDWQNQQIYQPVPSGRGSMLKNAGQSSSKGVEFSMKATPMDDFDALVSFGYTDARFDSYTINDTSNYNGNMIPYVPLFTMSFQASKTFRLDGKFLKGIRINGLYRLTGEHYWSEANTVKQDSYGVVDGTISFMTDIIDVDFWCRNIFDEDYTSFHFSSLGNNFVQRGKPQRFGIRLSAKF